MFCLIPLIDKLKVVFLHTQCTFSGAWCSFSANVYDLQCFYKKGEIKVLARAKPTDKSQ